MDVALSIGSYEWVCVYCLDLLPSLQFSLMQDLMPRTHSSVLTHFNWGRWLREMVRYVCVCASVCLSVCLSVSVCMCACLCLDLCVLAYYVYDMSAILSVCVCVSRCICIVYTWMSRCLLSWHGMIYVCTCECVRTLPVCLSVCVCVQVAIVCVCACMSVNSTCCAHVVDSPADL